ETVLHEVPARSLDHTGRDRPAQGEGEVVDEVGILGLDVGRGAGGCLGAPVAGSFVDAADVGADVGDDAGAVAFQDGAGGGGDPGGAGGFRGVEFVGGPPQVLDDVDEVDDDVGLHTAAFGFCVDAVELVVGAVDQDDPPASVVGIALLGGVEHGLHHGLGGAFEGGVQLPAAGVGALAALFALGAGHGQDVGR